MGWVNDKRTEDEKQKDAELGINASAARKIVAGHVFRPDGKAKTPRGAKGTGRPLGNPNWIKGCKPPGAPLFQKGNIPGNKGKGKSAGGSTATLTYTNFSPQKAFYKALQKFAEEGREDLLEHFVRRAYQNDSVLTAALHKLLPNKTEVSFGTAELESLRQAFVDIITKHVTDPVVLEKIASDLTRAFGGESRPAAPDGNVCRQSVAGQGTPTELPKLADQ